jgi:hypothetical protein
MIMFCGNFGASRGNNRGIARFDVVSRPAKRPFGLGLT